MTNAGTNNSVFSPAPRLTDDQGPKIHCEFLFQVIFGIISVMAILGNVLVCVVILKSRDVSRNSYIIMILVLAIVDALTGIIIALTPTFVVGEERFPVPEGLLGDLFCRLISSEYFVFTFGKISLFIVVLLAIERWYSMARPLKYRFSFSRNKTLLWISLIVVLSSAMNTPGLLCKSLIFHENKPKCAWKNIPKDRLADQVYTVFFVTITFFVPLLITSGTFLHLRMLINKPTAQNQIHRTRERSERYFLRMCAVTALFLGICWIPNQLFFLLSKFDVTTLQSTFHRVTIVLSMLNSCVNPWIYGATNKKYRKDFQRILCFWKRMPHVQPEDTEEVRATRTATVLSRLDSKPQAELNN